MLESRLCPQQPGIMDGSISDIYQFENKGGYPLSMQQFEKGPLGFSNSGLQEQTLNYPFKSGEIVGQQIPTL